MKKFILNLIFPIKCLACRKEGKFICPSCLEQIPLNKAAVKFSNQDGLKKIISTADYKHSLIKKAVHCYKYDFVKELSEPLGTLMANSWEIDSKNCVLIPVPLHKKRLRWRGFNQSKLLCQEISKQLNIPIADDILTRTKNTSPQAKIENLSKRKINPQKAFSLNLLSEFGFEKNKTIILVDDIATTGATLQECALALKPLKPKFIHAFVLAH